MIDPQLREARVSATDAVLRQFAALWLLAFGGLAASAALRDRPGRAVLWVVIAAAVGAVGLRRPQRIAAVFKVAMALAMPIGWVVSNVLLAAVFYAVFTPMAIVFRLIGRDALSRRGRPERDTYWEAKDQPSDPGSYLRLS